MRPSLSALALTLSLAAVPALAEETVHTLAGGIEATLNLPEAAGPVPAVLMLHGFGSSRDEVGGLYARTAAALAEQGIASLRIDFQGFGRSAGDTGAHSVDRQNADALTGLDALAAMPGVDPARLGVLGFSFGGGAAIQLAAERPDDVRSLVLWSSVGDYHPDFLQSLGQPAFDRAAAEGVVGLDLGWRTIVLKQDFFASLGQHDILGDLARYPGPVLTITGTEDYYHRYAQPMMDAAPGAAESLVMEGADHIFNVFDPAAPHAAAVIAATVARFAETL